MEAHSKIEEKVIKGKFVTITLTPESVERVVEVLNALVRKSKPDRYEEFIIKDLMKAMQNPEVSVEPIKQAPLATESLPLVPAPKEVPKEITGEDKKRMLIEIKGRLDPRNLKTLTVFIAESVAYGKSSLGIKTEPVAQTEESLWDWLYENHIINIDGSPVSDRH